MKKTTLFTFLLMILPFIGISQTFDFNGDDGGWIGNQATLTQNATSVTLDFLADSAPKLRNTTAGVNSSNAILEVIVQNNSSATQIRVQYADLQAGSGTSGTVMDITANDTGFKTYYIDLGADSSWNNAGAGGTQDPIDIVFREPGGMFGNNVDNDGSVEIDRVAFISSIPITPQTTYNFDTNGDAEGWEPNGTSDVTVAAGVLNLAFDGNAAPRIGQTLHSVDADANQYVHITIQNNSATDNQMRVSYPQPMSGRHFVNITISTSDVGFVTYDLDLTNAGWTGVVEDIDIRFRSDATNNSAGIGNVDVESIVFDNVLSVDQLEATNVKFFPNPAKDILYLENSEELSKIQVYDITGKRVLDITDFSNNQINTTNLKTGVYLIRLMTNTNQVISKKLVITK